MRNRIWIWAPPMAALCTFLSILLLGCGGGSAGTTGPWSVVTVVPNADFPTNLRFAPDGRLFYTEKNTGNVRIVSNGALLPTPFATLAVGTTGEQGLLGLTFDPDFATNHYVYVFYSVETPAVQRIARFTDVNNVGTSFTVLVDNLPEGSNHNSGKLVFGADGKLYATQGETGDPANAQLTTNPAGKVLRFNADGSIPGDNPIPGSPIYTLGHRNCFGLAVYPGTGTLYVSENGPTCDDEINRLTPGANYGWRPGQPCGDTNSSYTLPIRRYSSIIAPTGITFYSGTQFSFMEGDMLMTSYADGKLRRLTIDDNAPGHVVNESVLVSGLNGPTDVTVGPNGRVFIAASDAILELILPQ